MKPEESENQKIDNTQNILIKNLGLSGGYSPNSHIKNKQPPQSGDCFCKEVK